MQLNRYTARESDKSRILRTIGWCKRNHLTLAGLPYEDNLAGSDGISIEIITLPVCRGKCWSKPSERGIQSEMS